MIFESEKELLEFFNKLDLEKSVLVFKGEDAEEGSTEVTKAEKLSSESVNCDVDVSASSNALVESFTEKTSLPVKLTENNENYLYVENYEAVPNACGTGKLHFDDRIVHMNMCEEGDEAKVELTITLDESTYYSVPFILRKTDSNPWIELSKSYINS